ncbi:FMN-binding protein [uncultured Pseudoflavonifractor sp.]|uniref:FMN-binding protein n=1 Tax=uncultured Pseudoflavonifractor sp. TaxID=1221379 RepID=UPI0025ECDC00|nr:FMN-binding protein [uncultured Pseudoflavonifractor sp.]
MKKPLVPAVLSVALLLSLAGCTNTAAAPAPSAMPDGTYTAEMDDASAEAAYGWRDRLVVEYKDGALVSAVFDSYDADGNKKSETTPETYPMDPAPADWIPELSDNILKAGGTAEIDGVTGATIASNNARAMMQAILDSGVAGETVVVSEPTAG